MKEKTIVITMMLIYIWNHIFPSLGDPTALPTVLH